MKNLIFKYFFQISDWSINKHKDMILFLNMYGYYIFFYHKDIKYYVMMNLLFS